MLPSWPLFLPLPSVSSSMPTFRRSLSKCFAQTWAKCRVWRLLNITLYFSPSRPIVYKPCGCPPLVCTFREVSRSHEALSVLCRLPAVVLPSVVDLSARPAPVHPSVVWWSRSILELSLLTWSCNSRSWLAWHIITGRCQVSSRNSLIYFYFCHFILFVHRQAF